MSEEEKPRVTIVTFDVAELIVRIIEAATGTQRPTADPGEVLAHVDPATVAQAYRLGRAANDYFVERMNAAGTPIEQEEIYRDGSMH